MLLAQTERMPIASADCAVCTHLFSAGVLDNDARQAAISLLI